MESAGPPPVGATNQAAATVQSVARLEHAIRDRADTDRRFMNWWLYTLLVSWLTLGIAGIYYFYGRMARVGAFSRRKAAYYAALVEYTERRVESTGATAAIRPLTDQLRADLDAASQSAIKPIGAGLNFVLVIVTLGIWAIVWDYRIWTDPDRLYPEFHVVEDSVLQIARTA